MSKIFDAYRKQTAERSELSADIGRVGTVHLFPAPSPRQAGDFAKLASQILALRRSDRGTVLAVASSVAGEGASFVSYNTALILARDYGRKVCWIDANFLAPQAKLRVTDEPTFADLLRTPERAADLGRTVNPLLVAAGQDLPRAKNLIASRSYADLLAGLAVRFDLVLLDLPPMLASTDTALMAAATDGFLLVIEQQHLKWEVIDHGLEALRDKGVQTLGAVINRRSFALPKIIYDRL
ncbi:MAG: CpsD/CapB family tyrosine-protein kinase [Krumholzibacteria bacterium]|nr:CpsD/CapB family tyrosine-protein kinase [Candidatus Krumholzibacteria bacterium]